jgi:pyridoxine kinase
MKATSKDDKMTDNINTKNKKRLLPRVAALHDLSSFGRCALTVIIPTLSAMRAQCIPIPTALLSTHTGGFEGMHFRDLDADIEKTAEHLDSIGVELDAVYTGFLGSAAQVRTVEAFIDRFSKNASPLIFVDPVMGDDGELYSACFPELVSEMRRLIARAHVITPNLTEACLLAGVDFCNTAQMDAAEAQSFAAHLADRIKEFTPAECVITGIVTADGVGTYTANGLHIERQRGRGYPGTGDIFASVMLGKLLLAERVSAEAVCRAASFASEYVAEVIEFSEKYGKDEPMRDGVLLEACLSMLFDEVKND